MKLYLLLLSVVAAKCPAVLAQTEPRVQSLNHYITFLDKSAEVVIDRFQMLSDYHRETRQYKKKPGLLLRLPSSGPLEAYYFKKALSANGLTGLEKEKLNKGAEAIWGLLNEFDLACKQLETHVRLKAYENDNLKHSDELVAKIQRMFAQFSREKDGFYRQVHQAYRSHQPYTASDPYLVAEKSMEQVILSQRQLLDSLPYFLSEESRFRWPVETVRRSMLADEDLLATIGNNVSKLQYPASDALLSFKSALASMQSLKSRAIDDNTYAAQQSAVHGNESYMLLMRQFNQDLLAFYKSFVNYAQTQRRLLYYPSFSPVFEIETVSDSDRKLTGTSPFEDKPLISFTTKKSAAPARAEMIRTLNNYIEFVNESLRQMHLLQLTLRSYQSTAESYRNPVRSTSRAGLTFSHEKFKIPASAYALLMSVSTAVPEPYRGSVNRQTEVLMSMLKEMDDLGIELIAYTAEKQYLKDQLQHSDQILDRYLALFETFDKKKEQLYNDIRRVYESYSGASQESSWLVAGKALQKAMDDDRDVLFGIKSFLRKEIKQVPGTSQIESNARQLITDEYSNLKGLQRYGRSNGLCPYSPYEDLAENSIRFAELTKKLEKVSTGSNRQPFESFYYFYNNELVYQLNKFVELAKGGLLKAVNQPDLFIFTRTEMPKVQPQPDTVHTDAVRLDSVIAASHVHGEPVPRSLNGFAANNMVLLLDVSSSMNSPYKMPLLKRSIKSMLTLLRPEDQVSIVLYSGKARVVLKPTSGSRSAEIARMIDLLQSDGDTDGNEGIKLAYKTASKHYIRGGNNRIVLATDGEFPVSDEVMQMIGQHAAQDLRLTIFTFGRNAHSGQKLRKLSLAGKGTYAHVTEENADLQLILEAQGKKLVAE